MKVRRRPVVDAMHQDTSDGFVADLFYADSLHSSVVDYRRDTLRETPAAT
jgi:hypothetical protein